uniref:bis(5'-nucleosyl)-tetraphosphatase (symmetrical) YqeK n=1 Tax=Globicatella sulfidifaciens TaxID=136093 RepID=UPI0023F574CA|nr:bis(5'-nucleosyl)-tetraphosphatase (symmetrical) YqeK [Globicatella sulfidifaciens]
MEFSNELINVTREQLLSDLATKIKPKRYQHVLRVEATAIELAKQYGVDPEKASIAALMHDYAKDYPEEEMLALAQKRWDESTLKEANDNVWHGFAAATIAKEWYHIEDEDILTAISAHTIGWNEMSPLVKVVFIADYMEPGRDFPGVKKARKLAYKDIDAAVTYKMVETIKHLASEEVAIFLPTIEFYNQWILRRNV